MATKQNNTAIILESVMRTLNTKTLSQQKFVKAACVARKDGDIEAMTEQLKLAQQANKDSGNAIVAIFEQLRAQAGE